MPPTRDDLHALTKDPAAFLTHEDATLRRMAVSALGPDDASKHFDTLVGLASDPSEPVRTAAAEQLGFCGPAAGPVLAELGADQSDAVREAVATAHGERGEPDALGWLITVAGSDDNRQVREAAVAALGSIGDPSAIEPLLDFIASGPPQVRRRAIAAITVFDDRRIEPAIRRAALDRNPGVKEAAEMVVGRQIIEG